MTKIELLDCYEAHVRSIAAAEEARRPSKPNTRPLPISQTAMREAAKAIEQAARA